MSADNRKPLPPASDKKDIAEPKEFWSGLTDSDKKALAAQTAGRRFDLSVVHSVAKRCSYGFPQVTVCLPFFGGTPFPTVFWLTCPYLGKKCGALESEQQIAALEEIFAARQEEVRRWHGEYIRLRLSLLDPEKVGRLKENQPGLIRPVLENGVGGINYRENPGAAKCLHLQTAAWLGMGWHPAADWLGERLGGLDCPGIQCAKFTK